LDREDWAKLTALLRPLHESCVTDDGEEDQKKGTQLLEIYALEIQMYTARKDLKKLKVRVPRYGREGQIVPLSDGAAFAFPSSSGSMSSRSESSRPSHTRSSWASSAVRMQLGGGRVEVGKGVNDSSPGSGL
jgi:hypothetical protein